jgi:hypothetical protein
VNSKTANATAKRGDKMDKYYDIEWQEGQHRAYIRINGSSVGRWVYFTEIDDLIKKRFIKKFDIPTWYFLMSGIIMLFAGIVYQILGLVFSGVIFIYVYYRDIKPLMRKTDG